MDSHSKAPRKISARKSASSRPKLILGTIGLFLAVPSAFTVFASLFIFFYFIWAGGPDMIAIFDPIEVFAAAIYCGFLLGIVGGILGIVGLLRGEDIVVSGIAIILGVLMFGTCSVLTLLVMAVFFLGLWMMANSGL